MGARRRSQKRPQRDALRKAPARTARIPFEGQDGECYPMRCAQAILHRAVEAAGIHYIQELPGHARLKTTDIYTHVTRKHQSTIKSPLDDR